MRFPVLLVLSTVLLSAAGHAEDSTTLDPNTAETTTSAPTTAPGNVDPAAIRTQMQQRREAWRQLTPEQRRTQVQTRMQSARTQAQTLRNQRVAQ
jgi:hypothetical protein